MWQLYQCGVGRAPLTWSQTLKPVGANGHAHQSQGRVTHGRGHAPHLTVASLGDNEFGPGGRDFFADADRWIAWPQFWLRNEAYFRRARTAIVELHTMAQSIQCLSIRHTFDLNPISLGQFVFRFGNAGLQWSVVSEQQQSLAVVVESPGRAYLRF